MKIACIGWGSLVWRPENLQIQNKWFDDGPLLPIEFTRQSDNGRMTLIIDDSSSFVRTLWALMTVEDLPTAIKSLEERENSKKIDSVKTNEKPTNDNTKISIVEWLRLKNLDAAIWTNLSYSKKTDNKRPSIEYIIKHLKELDYNSRKTAEEYIRKAPKQIDTEFRRKMELEFGWTYLE